MKKQLKLYIFIDALGWVLTERYGFGKDFLPYRRGARTQFGYSAGAVPTILSGCTPKEHGHFSFFYYDPKHSPFRWMRFLPSWLMPDWFFSRHRVRHHISKLLAKILGYTGYFQLYRMPFSYLPQLNYSEKNDLFIAGGLAPVRNLADAWEGRNYHISNWRKSGEYNFDEMLSRVEKGDVEYAFLYNGAFDGFLHQHIAEPEKIEPEMRKYEAKVRNLYETAKKHYENVVVTVISDHGMTPLKETADFRELLSPFRRGTDYAVVFDSTMARFWWLNPAKKAEILTKISGTGKGHWLTPAEFQNFGIDFPDHRYGEDIYLLDSGIQFSPSDMGDKALPGMHGYTPDDEGSYGCFLSTETPDFEPRWIGDFFRIMAEK